VTKEPNPLLSRLAVLYQDALLEPVCHDGALRAVDATRVLDLVLLIRD
jgi:hypothetical protein